MLEGFWMEIAHRAHCGSFSESNFAIFIADDHLLWINLKIGSLATTDRRLNAH